MAFHVRRQLRDAIVAALKGLPTTGRDVYPGRTLPTPEAMRAALLVYVEGGQSRRDAMAVTGSLDREERVIVHARVRTTGAEPEDALHAIAAEIEPAIAGSAAIAALVHEGVLIQTDIISPPAAGQDRAGEMRLTYLFTLRTPITDPTQVL